MSSTPISDYLKSLDAFNSPSSVLKGFVMMAAAQYSTTVFYIAGKASPDSFGSFDGVYVPYNGAMDWMPFDKTQEFPHGMASWVLPLGLYEVLLVPSKEDMFKPRQELYFAVDEQGSLSRLTLQDVENMLNSGIQLPVPDGLFPTPVTNTE